MLTVLLHSRNLISCLLLIAGSLLPGCQKKAVPQLTDRKADPPAITHFEYPPRETVTPDTLAGRRIFIARCGRCHGLPEPVQFNGKKWDAILPAMFPRSRMNNEEALHVRTWILAHAAK